MFHFKLLQFHSHVNLLWFAVDLAWCTQKKLQCSPWWAKAQHVPNPWCASHCAFVIIADAVAMSAWMRNMASSCQPGWGKSPVNIHYYKNWNKLLSLASVSAGYCKGLETGRLVCWELSCEILILNCSDLDLKKIVFLCDWHKNFISKRMIVHDSEN